LPNNLAEKSVYHVHKGSGLIEEDMVTSPGNVYPLGLWAQCNQFAQRFSREIQAVSSS
jgi:hypothetical protein